MPTEYEKTNTPADVGEYLFPELTADEQAFLLLSPDGLAKKVPTGISLRKIALVRELLAMVLPAWPLLEIHKRTGISRDTLRAFVANEGEKVSLSGKELGGFMRAKATRWLVLAGLKEDEAPFRDLALAAKLMFDAAVQAENTGLVGEEKDCKADPRRVEAAARIRAMMEGRPAEAKRNTLSVGTTLKDNDLRTEGAVGGAVETKTEDRRPNGPGRPDGGAGGVCG